MSGNWLEPALSIVAALPRGVVRTHAARESKEEAKLESKKRRQRRWYYSESGKRWRENYKAKRREWERANQPKLAENHKRWRERNRDRYNLYQRMYYQANPKRKEYVRLKLREYRLKRKLEKLSTEGTPKPLSD